MFETIPAEISQIDFSQFGHSGFGLKKTPLKTRLLTRLCNWLLNLTVTRHPAAASEIAVIAELRERLNEQAVEQIRLARTLSSTLAAAELTHQELDILRAALGVAHRRYSDLITRREDSLNDTLLTCMEATNELDRIRESLVSQRLQPGSASSALFSSKGQSENRELGPTN